MGNNLMQRNNTPTLDFILEYPLLNRAVPVKETNGENMTSNIKISKSKILGIHWERNNNYIILSARKKRGLTNVTEPTAAIPIAL